MDARPWFLWSVELSEDDFRARLRDPEPAVRAQWQGLLLREARWSEIWSYVRLGEVLSNWEHVDRHLGRKRAFWNWLIDGWRKDGLLDDSTTDRPAT